MNNPSDSPYIEVEGRGCSPAVAALMLRLRVFCNLRWLVILGIIVITLVATGVFRIDFPTLPVYIICGSIALYNLVLHFQVRGLGKLPPELLVSRMRNYGIVHIVLDVLAFVVLLHFTGGVENPFIFFVALHIIGGSAILRRGTVYTIATIAFSWVLLLIGLEYAGILPHVNLGGFVSPTLYKEGSYLLAVAAALGSILYATAYMATAVTSELRKRQREVVKLREHLLQEKTGELEQASQQLVNLEEERSRFLRFLGMTAHDLKAPLAAIQSYFKVMLGGYSGELNEKQTNMLDRSSQRITELLSLISDLLDIPRIETGQILEEMKEVSFLEVLEHALEDLRDLASQQEVEIKTELPSALSPVHASAARLQQVMTNLVSNAVNYAASGTVTVRVAEEDNHIQVEVMDNGIGIPPEDLPRIFDDFFRASNVETKGTGLGLSITRRIIQAHGGSIWVESPCPETSVGSKFIFTLPKKHEAEGE